MFKHNRTSVIKINAQDATTIATAKTTFAATVENFSLDIECNRVGANKEELLNVICAALSTAKCAAIHFKNVNWEFLYKLLTRIEGQKLDNTQFHIDLTQHLNPHEVYQFSTLLKKTGVHLFIENDETADREYGNKTLRDKIDSLPEPERVAYQSTAPKQDDTDSPPHKRKKSQHQAGIGSEDETKEEKSSASAAKGGEGGGAGTGTPAASSKKGRGKPQAAAAGPRIMPKGSSKPAAAVAAAATPSSGSLLEGDGSSSSASSATPLAKDAAATRAATSSPSDASKILPPFKFSLGVYPPHPILGKSIDLSVAKTAYEISLNPIGAAGERNRKKMMSQLRALMTSIESHHRDIPEKNISIKETGIDTINSALDEIHKHYKPDMGWSFNSIYLATPRRKGTKKQFDFEQFSNLLKKLDNWNQKYPKLFKNVTVVCTEEEYKSLEQWMTENKRELPRLDNIILNFCKAPYSFNPAIKPKKDKSARVAEAVEDKAKSSVPAAPPAATYASVGTSAAGTGERVASSAPAAAVPSSRHPAGIAPVGVQYYPGRGYVPLAPLAATYGGVRTAAAAMGRGVAIYAPTAALASSHGPLGMPAAASGYDTRSIGAAEPVAQSLVAARIHSAARGTSLMPSLAASSSPVGSSPRMRSSTLPLICMPPTRAIQQQLVEASTSLMTDENFKIRVSEFITALHIQLDEFPDFWDKRYFLQGIEQYITLVKNNLHKIAIPSALESILEQGISLTIEIESSESAKAKNIDSLIKNFAAKHLRRCLQDFVAYYYKMSEVVPTLENLINGYFSQIGTFILGRIPLEQRQGLSSEWASAARVELGLDPRVRASSLAAATGGSTISGTVSGFLSRHSAVAALKPPAIPEGGGGGSSSFATPVAAASALRTYGALAPPRAPISFAPAYTSSSSSAADLSASSSSSSSNPSGGAHLRSLLDQTPPAGYDEDSLLTTSTPQGPGV